MNSSRRAFFTKGFLAIAALPLLKSQNVLAAVACPQGAPKDAEVVKKLLDPASAAGKRLDYVENAADSKNKLFKAGDNCGNCNFYNDKKMVENHAPCTMAANRYVTHCGWCKSYRKDPKKA
jgi:hypothetical protein